MKAAIPPPAVPGHSPLIYLQNPVAHLSSHSRSSLLVVSSRRRLPSLPLDVLQATASTINVTSWPRRRRRSRRRASPLRCRARVGHGRGLSEGPIDWWIACTPVPSIPISVGREETDEETDKNESAIIVDPPLNIDQNDLSKMEDQNALPSIARQHSCDVFRSMAWMPPDHQLKDLEKLKSAGLQEHMPRVSSDCHSIMSEAWETLRRSLVYFRGKPIGTVAALDHTEEALNYNQVFVRDFVPSALAFLMNKEPEIVKNFLVKTLRLQSWDKTVDYFKLGTGVMPASFKVHHKSLQENETLVADFGGSAIGRVAPVDSGFWWIFLLRAYTKSTGDTALAERPECQNGMRLILSLCLSDGFDTFPTLLCADGCCMIDRRMGVYGYPIEIQALFFMALRCALALLKQDNEGKEFVHRINVRLQALSYHIRTYFWLDFRRLNDIYRYKTEEYSHTAVNKFNVMPDSIPDWIFDFMPNNGGYFIGNVSPSRMDFRWFCIGNCIAVISSLATPVQGTAFMDLIEERWTELVGEMPIKVCYPALEGHEWRIVTGCDPKNTRWSYHNGGSWPVLLWLLTAACIKTGRPNIARRAIDLAESRLLKDNWPEYYDGKAGRYIGKQARKFQTWTAAGYLVAKMMLEDPTHVGMVSLEEDKQIKSPLRRSASLK